MNDYAKNLSDNFILISSIEINTSVSSRTISIIALNGYQLLALLHYEARKCKKKYKIALIPWFVHMYAKISHML